VLLAFFCGWRSGHDFFENALEEQPARQGEDRQEDRQAIPEDVAEETGTMHPGIVGDGFYHEVRPVADVGHGPEEDRAKAYRDDERGCAASSAAVVGVAVEACASWKKFA